MILSPFKGLAQVPAGAVAAVNDMEARLKEAELFKQSIDEQLLDWGFDQDEINIEGI